LQAGIDESLVSSIDAELCEAICAASLFGRRERVGAIEIFHLGGDLCIEERRVELRNPVDATFAGKEVVPERIDVVAEWANDAEAGDYDSSLCPIARHKNKGAAWATTNRSCP
jgi:hypothetical protein